MGQPPAGFVSREAPGGGGLPPWSAETPGEASLPTLVHVLPRPGVTDPVAASTLGAIADFGWSAEAVVTLRKYWVGGLTASQLHYLIAKLLANESVEQVVIGPLQMREIHLGHPYRFQRVTIPLRELDELALGELSRQRMLSLSLLEMQTIQAHYRALGRDPTDIELETIAQTWSEHCSHKTLTGQVQYRDEQGERHFHNLLKETIFAATERIRRERGADDFCVSVFRDNAGVVRFDDRFHVAFKVETHNRPSALEPYGGANTGVGGVIRDVLGTGLGARPVCNTDVFCFAPPDLPQAVVPPGVLHPRRILRGVVAGVRDYGNRMGIPTVNGAIWFDERYVGNPLVFCGTVGLLPVECTEKAPQPGDLIVTLGGRTGRDGIHGATFSSAALTHESEQTSGGAVQIGNAITEKMLLDVLLAARDEGLLHAVTDCGAGGFSSAIGEMAASIGAEVWLERAPLKYEGLSYTEIWISEAQERMVLAVPEAAWPRLQALCQSEGVEATVIGRFVPTGRLLLTYQGQTVGELDLQFLHHGRPRIVRQAVWQPADEARAARTGQSRATSEGQGGGVGGMGQTAHDGEGGHTAALLALLACPTIASKEWVIRQYDHEVQGGSVIKPLVGQANDGPSDAAVLRPVLSSPRGIVVACGLNPLYGDHDPYCMAACAIDEAVRNCVAVGADPRRIALLDNFCWGNTDDPQTLGALVRAALACYDVAVALGTPFISGKDSLHNVFRYEQGGRAHTIQIPHTLLISAVGQVADVLRCVTMDLKTPGNLLYQVGPTREELAGSHYEQRCGLRGRHVPRVDVPRAKRTFLALHGAIQQGWVRACHDLSEGGLAVAIAEMCLAGGLGARLRLADVPCEIGRALEGELRDGVLLFSESPSRFLVEVPPAQQSAFERCLSEAEVPWGLIGHVTSGDRLQIASAQPAERPWCVDVAIDELKRAWQRPLRF
jgi:phosphoribosylformylglycinamidine synthase